MPGPESAETWTPHRLGLVVGAGIGMFFGIGTLLLYSFGVFIQPIAHDTGWDRTSIAAAIAPAALAIGLLSPLIGWLTDRFGPRKVLTFSAVSQSLGLAMLGYLPTDTQSFALFAILASMLGSAQTPVPYAYFIMGWFNRRRGLAMGIALAFGGLGVAVIPMLAAGLISWAGWRLAYVLIGAVSLVSTLVVARWLVRDPPRQAVATGRSPNHGISLKQASKTYIFWFFLLSFTLNALAAAAGSISLPSILVDRGAAPENAASVMAFVGIAMIGSRLGFGALLDRVTALPLTAAVFLAPVVGHLILAYSNHWAGAYGAAVLFGIATGSEGDALSYLLSRQFGMSSFGKIFGINFCGFALGTGLGPALFAYMSTSAHDQTVAFQLLAGLGALSACLLIFIHFFPRRYAVASQSVGAPSF